MVRITKVSPDTPVSIVWFQNDLRLSDNPALLAAVKQGCVLPIYIHHEAVAKKFQAGRTSLLWLRRSLALLDEALGHQLQVYTMPPEKVFKSLAENYKVTHVFWNRRYEPWQRETYAKIEALLEQLGIAYQAFNGNYLHVPEAILKPDGSYYRVYSAYKKRALEAHIEPVLAKPDVLDILSHASHLLKDTPELCLPEVPWEQKVGAHWQVGEVAAHQKLKDFMSTQIDTYGHDRDYPALDATSKLSPHLHFGEISPRLIWHAAQSAQNPEVFMSELLWREFSCYLLYHFKALGDKNFNSKFDAFPWRNNQALLSAWQEGATGYPLIDAGMRELWQTGYMHNRIRMVVASFLVKNLMLHWHHGRDWFWDCLVDADFANNSASWQWVAGSGADAAPYFRIFNPVLQGEKFDAKGFYTRHYVPELAKLPQKYLFAPWRAPQDVLDKAGIVLGKTYPKPIVDVSESRKDALAAYTKSVRG